MGEPGGVRNEVIEAGNLLAGSIVTTATTKHDKALALPATLPFIIFHLSNSVLTVQQALFWVLRDDGKQNRAYILVGAD